MGVSDLWPIFDDNEVSKDKNLADLRGKRVAVDLSCWIMQSKTTGGLNTSKKPHLKLLFDRTKKLLLDGILPIFVMEGKAPECKGAAIRKRLKIAKSSAGGDISRASYDKLQKECQELLRTLGVPCVRSTGEAEALCAFLNSREVVDGCITEDNDAFLYGAKMVYRGFTTHQSKEMSQLKAYAISDIEQKLKLNRSKLIALALLLGCDYMEGVPGIGRETALKLIAELERHGYNILDRFRDWKTKSRLELFPFEKPEFEGKAPSHCTMCGHPGKLREHKQVGCTYCDTEKTCNPNKKGESCLCAWHQNFVAKEQFKFESKVYDTIKKMENFSYEEVISEYLEEKNILPPEKELTWLAPDIAAFQVKTMDWFGWTLDAASEKMFPVYIFWQIMQKINRLSADDRSFLYKPLRVDKIQKVLGVKKYKIIWESLDGDDNKSECQTTLNDIEDFNKAYPTVVSKYEQEIEQKRVMKENEKKAKRKKEKKTSEKKTSRKENKSLESNSSSSNKISHYFLPMHKNSGKSSQSIDDSNTDYEPPVKRPSNPANTPEIIIE